MCVELRKLHSNGAIRVSNEGQNTFDPHINLHSNKILVVMGGYVKGEIYFDRYVFTIP